MVQVTVASGETNLAVRLPSEIVQATRLREAERVEIKAQGGVVTIRHAATCFVLKIFSGAD